MDKSALAMTGFKPLSKHFSRQKSSAHFGEKCEKGVSIRKPTSGLTVSKASGRQYCMQSIPLAVLKHVDNQRQAQCRKLHAIHTACGIETMKPLSSDQKKHHCMQSIPLAVLKQNRPFQNQQDCYCMQSIPLAVLKPLSRMTSFAV